MTTGGYEYRRYDFDPIYQTFYELKLHDLLNSGIVVSEENGEVRLDHYIKLLLVMAGYETIRRILFAESGKRRSKIAERWYVKTLSQPDDIWTQTWIQCGR